MTAYCSTRSRIGTLTRPRGSGGQEQPGISSRRGLCGNGRLSRKSRHCALAPDERQEEFMHVRLVEADVEARTDRPRVAVEIDEDARVRAGVNGRRERAEVVVIGGGVQEGRVAAEAVPADVDGSKPVHAIGGEQVVVLANDAAYPV